jgi:hypothetical protein
MSDNVTRRDKHRHIQNCAVQIEKFYKCYDIGIGGCGGLTPHRSCYVDYTQGILDRKHGGKTTLTELTSGSKRWNEIMNGRTSNTVDLNTNIHKKDV